MPITPKSTKKSHRLALVFVVLILFWMAKLFFSQPQSPNTPFLASEKLITITDDGLLFQHHSRAETVSQILEELNLKLSPEDQVFPLPENTLSNNSHLQIRRAKKIKLTADGKTETFFSLEKDVFSVLLERNVKLNPLDKFSPNAFASTKTDLEIIVTRINVEEKIIPEDIDYKTITKLDNKLGWREKKTEQVGEKGIREIKYKITYKDGKEVSRIVLGKSVTKEPIEEIILQGTHVKTGKTHKGLGTWYAFKGGLFAASPWLPMGSYAKVTNQANGKSVIVEINDRGPFGPGRIIDLDKVAFAKIASIGAGVIDVKVEEVLN